MAKNWKKCFWLWRISIFLPHWKDVYYEQQVLNISWDVMQWWSWWHRDPASCCCREISISVEFSTVRQQDTSVFLSVFLLKIYFTTENEINFCVIWAKILTSLTISIGWLTGWRSLTSSWKFLLSSQFILCQLSDVTEVDCQHNMTKLNISTIVLVIQFILGSCNAGRLKL